MAMRIGRKWLFRAGLLAGATTTVAVAGAMQVGCSGGSSSEGGSTAVRGGSAEPAASNPGDATGSLGFSLTLPGGGLVNSVTYSLLTSGGTLVTLPGAANPGTVPVNNSQSIDFQLGGVPAATGDSITLTASTTSGGTCQGSASGINVVAGATQTVRVQMLCSLPGADAGNLFVTGVPSYCGTWTALSSNSSEVYVGESITLTATATGPDPGNLGYTWTMSNPIGVFGAIQANGGVGTPGQDEAAGPSDPMQFLCTSPGTTTVTVTIDDGPLPDAGLACPTSSTTTTVICDVYPTNQVESAWVEIGSGNVAIARALTAAVAAGGGANPCPNITVNGGAPQQMNLRAAATTSLSLRTTIVTPNKPSIFPVSSCELTLPAGATSAVVAGQSLPLPKPNPQKIVVLGDTGCRMEVGSPPQFQSCNDPSQYPFATIAALAAAQQPDLVLHVGDYQYRESECPAGMSSATGCGGSPWGYGWDTWEADFFVPGAPLLEAAPWVMVRGNHESCNRAGQGWFRFLDTNAYDPVTKNCNSSANDTSAAGGNYNDPFLVSINSSTQLVVFDSSNIPKSAPASGTTPYTVYQSELTQAGALLANPLSFNWWANHHPILGYQTSSPPTSAAPGLAGVMANVYPNTYFPPPINLALHGHVHDFQAINFAPGTGYSNAATLVSGNAGDALDVALPWPMTASPDTGVTVASEGAAGAGSAMANSAAFGYMVLQFQSASSTWLMTEYRVDNSVRDTCTVQTSGQMTCTSYGYLP